MLFWVFPLAKLVLHLCTTSGYGVFRDELYYLACSDHLSWGYVDHPALSIWLLWVVRRLFGDSLFALRLVPAVAGALTVALVGKTAKVLGGGKFAQALAMTGALISGEYLGTDFYYSMNSLDLLAWAAVAYLVARLMIEESPRVQYRLWILLGVVCGLGLANKIGLLWLGAGLAAGLILTPARRWLLTPWPWVVALIAVLGLWPYLHWQVLNDWSTLEWMHNATTEKMAPVSLIDFLRGQLLGMHPLNVVVWLAGLLYLFFHSAAKPFRILGWMWLTVAAILASAAASRASYLAPAYTWLFAAGGVAWERLLAKRPAALRVAFIAILLAAGAALLPFAIPVLPVDTYVRFAAALGQKPSTEEKKEVSDLPQWYADMQGWRQIAQQIARAYNGLPPAERAHAAVFGGDYGVAGAVDFFGPELGLPKAISSHNSYWLWGPRDWDGQVLVIPSRNERRLRGLFESVEQVGTIECGHCMPYENHLPIWVCRRVRIPVPQIWIAAKHFD
jgi:hypothetical protein